MLYGCKRIFKHWDTFDQPFMVFMEHGVKQMDNTGSKKILILYIYEILKRYSDVNHLLSQSEIASLVQDVYGMTCDRNSRAQHQCPYCCRH